MGKGINDESKTFSQRKSVGHSYDLDVEELWDRIENVFRMIASHDDILPMTTIEIVELLRSLSSDNQQ